MIQPKLHATGLLIAATLFFLFITVHWASGVMIEHYKPVAEIVLPYAWRVR